MVDPVKHTLPVDVPFEERTVLVLSSFTDNLQPDMCEVMRGMAAAALGGMLTMLLCEIKSNHDPLLHYLSLIKNFFNQYSDIVDTVRLIDTLISHVEEQRGKWSE